MWKFLACLTVFILVTEHCKLHPLGISEYDTKNWTWSFHNAPDVHITERIVRVCLYMRKISRRAYEPVTFQITLDDRPKRMDANGVPTRELINSGYQDGGTIVVYRREEVDKVCLHELVHLFRMDARPSGDAIRAALGLHVAGVHEPTEAIAETVAQLVLCHYIAETYGRDLQELYKTENEFGRRQAAKVLRWMKIDDIFTSEIRQDTYAIEYYVLRAILFDFALRRGTHVLLSHTFLQGAEEVSDEVVVAFCIEAWSPANSLTLEGDITRIVQRLVQYAEFKGIRIEPRIAEIVVELVVHVIENKMDTAAVRAKADQRHVLVPADVK